MQLSVGQNDVMQSLTRQHTDRENMKITYFWICPYLLSVVTLEWLNFLFILMRMLICDAMVMIQTADILINAGVPPQQRAARPGQHYSTLLIAAFLFWINCFVWLCTALVTAALQCHNKLWCYLLVEFFNFISIHGNGRVYRDGCLIQTF